jgi:succinoglycan biosynthesis protein ExoO
MTYNTPLRVTVIIPAYKVGDTLAMAAQSVLQQTERDLELIIVDDASPDNTFEVASMIANGDSRVRIIRQAVNGGKPRALNTATSQARGRWIAVLDGDDWYAPNRLERLLDAAEAAGVDMVTDNQIFFDLKANKCVGTAFPQGIGPRRFDLDAFMRESDPTARFDYGMLKQIYRADFIREHKVEYYEPARTGEDFYGLLCFFVAGGIGLVLDEPLYYYVQPFGMLSREWAQDGRRPYNYELLVKINNHFVNELRGKLSPANLRLLEKRGRGLEAMMYFHQIRECLHMKDISGIMRRIGHVPPNFWMLLCGRMLQRIGLRRDESVTPLSAS